MGELGHADQHAGDAGIGEREADRGLGAAAVALAEPREHRARARLLGRDRRGIAHRRLAAVALLGREHARRQHADVHDRDAMLPAGLDQAVQVVAAPGGRHGPGRRSGSAGCSRSAPSSNRPLAITSRQAAASPNAVIPVKRVRPCSRTRSSASATPPLPSTRSTPIVCARGLLRDQVVELEQLDRGPVQALQARFQARLDLAAQVVDAAEVEAHLGRDVGLPVDLLEQPAERLLRLAVAIGGCGVDPVDAGRERALDARPAGCRRPGGSACRRPSRRRTPARTPRARSCRRGDSASVGLPVGLR